VIEARYSGRCPDCGGMWEPGDLICGADNALPLERRRRPTVWRHVACPDDVDTTPTHPVCPTCWLTHPEGACDR